METTKKDISTREKLLGAAVDLMIAKGYSATAIDEICSKAEVTKGSFFHYFKNKEDLGRAVIELFSEMKNKAIKEAVTDKLSDPLERIYGYIDFAIEMSKQPDMRGCLVGTLAQELSQTHPELRDLCAKSFDGFTHQVCEELVRAKAEHPPKVDFDVNGLAEHFLSVIQGALIISKARQERLVFEQSLSHLKNYIKLLFGE